MPKGERRVLLQPYTDINALQRDLEGMDDSEQRRFVRGLVMETHVTLHTHIEDEKLYKDKVDKIHDALFDPLNGLVYLREWMCRIATRAGVIFVAACASFASLAGAGHSLGWW